jgi:hypothetical protein
MEMDMRSMARSTTTTIFLLFVVLLLLMMAVAEGATRREIVVVCDELKIVFEIPKKAKWSMRLVTDKKTYNCQIVSGK